MHGMKVTKRDFEVLRTLVRVQLARTRSLQDTFFPNMGVARRRLRVLRSYGLVTTHNKGLPGNLAAAGGAYWRLTERGLDTFMREFPNDRVPENLVARTTRASLRCFEHRDEMTATYLRLIYSQDQDGDEIRARSDLLDWRGEYDVKLEFSRMGARRQLHVIPDATLTTEGSRVFLEVDRSTESHTRCKRSLEGYRQSIREGNYRKEFPDDLPVIVLYITKSARRAKGLQTVIDGLRDLPFRGLAMVTSKATEWLRDITADLPAEDNVKAEFQSACLLLRRLYDDYRRDLGERKAQGLAMPTSTESLMDAYNFLRMQSGRQQ